MTTAPTTTTPETRSPARDDELVARLQQSEIFRDYREAFETATGLPLVLRGAGSFASPLSGSKQINRFCAVMAATSKTCAACLQLQARIESEAANGTTSMHCFAGLTDSAIPIRLGTKVVAYLQTGQVFLRRPTQRDFNNAIRQIEALGLTVDPDHLREAYFETRVLTKSHYEATLRLLASFAQHLSSVTNELMIQQTSAEPPAISRARAYIAEHLVEELSLGQVARVANMSAFYFCKIFKAATGLTFTDYVARARVERTKQMLLNPNVRVSEAAYASGCQSLSQFNRVFHRITGEAPTAYRKHLHASPLCAA